MFKERIVVICQGRGAYNRETSGYLKTYGKAAKDRLPGWIFSKNL